MLFVSLGIFALVCAGNGQTLGLFLQWRTTVRTFAKIGKKEYLIGCSYALCFLSFAALRICRRYYILVCYTDSMQ
jgi:hypothetical protein